MRLLLLSVQTHHQDDQQEEGTLNGHMNILTKNWSVHLRAEEFKDACVLVILIFEEDVSISEEIGKDNEGVEAEEKKSVWHMKKVGKT